MKKSLGFLRWLLLALAGAAACAAFAFPRREIRSRTSLLLICVAAGPALPQTGPGRALADAAARTSK
jgi:hypothetical protein